MFRHDSNIPMPPLVHVPVLSSIRACILRIKSSAGLIIPHSSKSLSVGLPTSAPIDISMPSKTTLFIHPFLHSLSGQALRSPVNIHVCFRERNQRGGHIK